jgi:hypothetical protein
MNKLFCAWGKGNLYILGTILIIKSLILPLFTFLTNVCLVPGIDQKEKEKKPQFYLLHFIIYQSTRIPYPLFCFYSTTDLKMSQIFLIRSIILKLLLNYYKI